MLLMLVRSIALQVECLYRFRANQKLREFGLWNGLKEKSGPPQVDSQAGAYFFCKECDWVVNWEIMMRSYLSKHDDIETSGLSSKRIFSASDDARASRRTLKPLSKARSPSTEIGRRVRPNVPPNELIM